MRYTILILIYEVYNWYLVYLNIRISVSDYIMNAKCLGHAVVECLSIHGFNSKLGKTKDLTNGTWGFLAYHLTFRAVDPNSRGAFLSQFTLLRSLVSLTYLSLSKLPQNVPFHTI